MLHIFKTSDIIISLDSQHYFQRNCRTNIYREIYFPLLFQITWSSMSWTNNKTVSNFILNIIIARIIAAGLWRVLGVRHLLKFIYRRNFRDIPTTGQNIPEHKKHIHTHLLNP